MNPNNRQVTVVYANTGTILNASPMYRNDTDKIVWKKKVFTDTEIKKGSHCLIWKLIDNGETIGTGNSISYTFSKKDEGKYIRLYAYVNSVQTPEQIVAYYVEPAYKTEIRIAAVNVDKKEVVTGDIIKCSVEYSRQSKPGVVIPEEKVTRATKDSVKWMVKIDNQEERLVINDEVIRGGEISFIIPEEWEGKVVLLMPYLGIHTLKVNYKLDVKSDPSYRFYFEASNFVSFDKERYKNSIERLTEEYKKDNYSAINQSVIFYYNDKKYQANSCATLFGRDGVIGLLGGFKDIYTFSKYDFLFVLGHGGYVFYDYGYRNALEFTVLHESVGLEKLLDYKFEFFRINDIHSNALVEIDKIVYNANELGNYLWGMVLEYYGILISPNLIAELGTRGRKDEPWEQRAITVGRNKANSLKISKDDTDYIIQKRMEFRLLYNDKDKAWRKIDLRKRN